MGRRTDGSLASTLSSEDSLLAGYPNHGHDGGQLYLSNLLAAAEIQNRTMAVDAYLWPVLGNGAHGQTKRHVFSHHPSSDDIDSLFVGNANGDESVS